MYTSVSSFTDCYAFLENKSAEWHHKMQELCNLWGSCGTKTSQQEWYFIRSTWLRSSDDIYGHGRRPFSVHRSKNLIGNIMFINFTTHKRLTEHDFNII